MQDEITVKTPNEYINTGKASLLAVIKLIEALVGCLALGYMSMNRHAIQTIIRDFYEGLLFKADAQSAFYSVYGSLMRAIQGIIFFELLLIVISGFGSFFVRTAHKGAGLVKLCHRIRYLFSLAGFLGSFVILFRYFLSMMNAAQTVNRIGVNDILALLGSYELILYVIVILGAFWILLEYDLYVARVMKQVAKEVKAGAIQPMRKKNRLGRESAWLCGILTASAALSVIELAGGDSILAGLAGFLTPIQLLYRGSNAVSIAAAIALAIRFFLVNRCCADFDHAH